jgi:nucleoid DNA-binding protein
VGLKPSELIKAISDVSCLPKATVRRVLSGLSKVFLQAMIDNKELTLYRVGRFKLVKHKSATFSHFGDRPIDEGTRYRVRFNSSPDARKKIRVAHNGQVKKPIAEIQRTA